MSITTRYKVIKNLNDTYSIKLLNRFGQILINPETGRMLTFPSEQAAHEYMR